MTARRIIAKGCIHLPKTSERPLAASVRLVRASASSETAAGRPLADTSVKRWASRDE